MADLVNMAGEGLPLYLWTKLAAPGQSPWEVGQERAQRESGAFSYRTPIVRDLIGAAVEMDADAAHGVRVGLDWWRRA